MNEDIKKDRSPNCPKTSLLDAVEMAKKLYAQAGKSKLKPIAAAGALGYSGLSGASLTALGVLKSYGLIMREKSEISVSPLAIQLLHPIDANQERFAKVTAALTPKVFNELYSEGHRDSNEAVIKNHLIQKGFMPDAAIKAAQVYMENFSFANLSNDGRLDEKVEEKENELGKKVPAKSNQQEPSKPINQPKVFGNVMAGEEIKNVLATYLVPLGANEAKLIFTGEALRPQDFDALADYVALFKKQYQRKIEEEALNGATSMKDAAINLANITGDNA